MIDSNNTKIYDEILINIIVMIYIVLLNLFFSCKEYSIKLIMIKINYQVLLVPNEQVLQITVKFVIIY